MEIAQRLGQFAAHGAAHAARLQQHHRVVDALDEMVVEADLAEFVDQHGGVGERGIGEQALEQRRLARAEKAGEEMDWREGGQVSHPRPPPCAR